MAKLVTLADDGTKGLLDSSEISAVSIPKNIGATYTVNEIQVLTQAEYDAIVTPDAGTLYFII